MQKINFPVNMVKCARRAAAIMAGVIILIVIVRALNYAYVSEDNWCRILWHHFYEDQEKIDNLYLGSSHVYYDIDPRILDQLNEEYNFNLATPMQRPKGSFYLLREADRRNTLSHVYLELYYMCSVKNNFHPEENIFEEYKWEWLNSDYMRISANKLSYMLSIAGPENYIDVILPFTRYRSELGNLDYVKQTIAEKKEEDYCNYQYGQDSADGNGYESCMKQGFFYTTGELEEQLKRCRQDRILDEQSMLEESMKYYSKIIQYCQKREIPITLFISPIYDLQLVSTLNYDNYINEAKALAAEYEVPFYDFNLTKEEYLPIQQGEYFRDVGHLNSAGASMFTPFFYQVVSGEESKNDKYFYQTYAEKLENTESAVYGLYYRDLEEPAEMSERLRVMWIASNRDVGMEYRIILTPTEGEQYMVQDFNANKEFTVPRKEHGICTIVARMEGKPDEVQTMEVGY